MIRGEALRWWRAGYDAAVQRGRGRASRREETLGWWRAGYEAGYQAGERDRADRGQADHDNAVREFYRQRREDEQARVDAVLLEAIDVLARAMLGEGVAMEDESGCGAA